MLQHQMQPTFNTCMATCVAMVAGQPVDEVLLAGTRLFTTKQTGWMMPWIITKSLTSTAAKENVNCFMGLFIS